jgi:hypothetical protein
MRKGQSAEQHRLWRDINPEESRHHRGCGHRRPDPPWAATVPYRFLRQTTQEESRGETSNDYACDSRPDRNTSIPTA